MNPVLVDALAAAGTALVLVALGFVLAHAFFRH